MTRDASTLPGARFAAGDRVTSTRSGATGRVLRGEHHCLGDPETVYVWVAFDAPVNSSGKCYPSDLALDPKETA